MTVDIRHSHLQASEPLEREVFITKPASEFELSRDQNLELLKPLHGLCDAGDPWHINIEKNHRNKMGMILFRIDMALYYLLVSEILKGLSGSSSMT